MAGVVVGRTAYDRLHFAGLGSVPAALLLAVAVGVEEGVSGAAMRTWLAVAFVVVGSPVLAAAAARALRAEQTGREPAEGGP